jgi:uncharacterized membrane protein YgcG
VTVTRYKRGWVTVALRDSTAPATTWLWTNPTDFIVHRSRPVPQTNAKPTMTTAATTGGAKGGGGDGGGGGGSGG